MDHIRQVFGEDADLYQVLGLKSRDDGEDPAKLRKAYYRKALVWHPDKTTKDPKESKDKFQAISFAYNVLKNPEKRQEYNETGHVDEEGDDDDATKEASFKTWKDYFDRIFGQVTVSKIDQFATKYKCSEEEQKDVLKEYKQRKGDLVKMLDFLMLSTELDAKRWMEDYIQPAIDNGSIPDYSAAANKALKKLQKKIDKQQEKENQKKENQKPDSEGGSEEDEMDDEEEEAMSDSETESEDEEAIASPSPPKKTPAKKKATPAKKKVTATKAKPTKAKPTKKNAKVNSAKKASKKEDDLVAMIQANQSKRSGGLFASIGARYGVTMEDDSDNNNNNDDDPMNDEEFAKIQARMTKQKNTNKKARR